MHQGEAGLSAYIIEDGLVEITLEKDNGMIQNLGTRGAGTIIGEMALIDKKPRTATVRALEDCVLLEITLPDFQRRLDKSDPVVRMMIEVILTRYRDMLHNSHLMVAPGNIHKSEALEQNYLEKSKTIDRLKMEKDLQDAFSNQDLMLHYQPIFDIRTNKTIGCESLIRWKHPEHGFISPELFIPVAEESGLIIDISQWVLKTACQTLNLINQTPTINNDIFMSINFSSVDLADKNFKQNFINITNKQNIDPSRIHLEITERLLIEDPETTRETLNECHDQGISISIDDFGTGYSSLSYLHYFPINVLKIDRSFINNINQDQKTKDIVLSIINMAKTMGMEIIAEGIETLDQQETLKVMGCPAGQGYIYSKPLPKEEFIAFLLQNNRDT